MINFRCDQCNQKLSVSDSQAGQKVKCIGCKNAILVPHIKKIQICKSQKETESHPDNREKLADSAGQEQASIIKTNSTNIGDHAPVSGTEGSKDLDSYALAETTKNCPYCGEEILELAKKCKHCGEFLESATTENCRSGYGRNTPPHGSYGNSHAPVIYVNSGAPISQTPNIYPHNRNKVVAFLLAWFLGGIGVHKFYLGQTGWGVVYLLFFWTWIPVIISFIEGILYLCMSEDDFNMKYNR